MFSNYWLVMYIMLKNSWWVPLRVKWPWCNTTALIKNVFLCTSKIKWMNEKNVELLFTKNESFVADWGWYFPCRFIFFPPVAQRGVQFHEARWPFGDEERRRRRLLLPERWPSLQHPQAPQLRCAALSWPGGEGPSSEQSAPQRGLP